MPQGEIDDMPRSEIDAMPWSEIDDMPWSEIDDMPRSEIDDMSWSEIDDMPGSEIDDMPWHCTTVTDLIIAMVPIVRQWHHNWTVFAVFRKSCMRFSRKTQDI